MTLATTPTEAALAEQEQQKPKTPRGLIEQYRGDLAAVMPSHIRPDTWVRLAQGALKKGKKVDDGTGRTELEVAAANNPGLFLAALLDAARLGLEPGTEEYWLTPRREKGKLQILGYPGYQGYIKLMYNSGRVMAVIAECVYDADVFIWRKGSLDTEQIAKGKPPRWEGPQTTPYHEVDWDAEKRGALRLVYAYAVMIDGTPSQVIMLNKYDIKAIKANSLGADSKYSPWQTNPRSMWLKSAVRQLRKWVPTSTEVRTTAKKVEAERTDRPEKGETFTAPRMPENVPYIDGEFVSEYDGDADDGVTDAPDDYYADDPYTNIPPVGTEGA